MPRIPPDRSKCTPGPSSALILEDDELHAADDDLLFIVTEVAIGTNGITLLSVHNGATRLLGADIVYEALARGKLRVRRNGMPFVPPELEADPRVRFDEDGYF